MFAPSPFAIPANTLPFSDVLDLGTNDLTGTIPSQLAALTLLDTLWLYDNNVTGPFTCPEFVEKCGVLCTNGTLPKCRTLV